MMKKYIFPLVGFFIACSALFGCVEDNQYVLLRGITPAGSGSRDYQTFS